MRVIFNIHSNRAAGDAGWRAREVHIGDKSETTLAEVLKTTTLADGSSIYYYLIEKDLLKNDWLLYVNGMRISRHSSLKIILKDNTQIHLMDNPESTD